MDDRINSANIKYSRAQFAYLQNWGLIWSFKKLSEISWEKGITDYFEYLNPVLKEFMPDGKFRNTLKDPKPTKDEIMKSMKSLILKQSASVTCATSMVFAHALLDGLLFEFLEIGFELKPDFFVQNIKEQKIKIEMLLNDKMENIIEKKAHNWLLSLEKESMIKKIDLLYQICKPEKNPMISPDYSYNRGRVVDFDNKRHAIIHRPSLQISYEGIEDDLMYIFYTGMYFLLLMHDSFGLFIDPNIIIGKNP